MKFNLTFKGQTALERKLSEMGPRYERAGMIAQLDEATEIMTKARARAPHEGGDLEKSGFVRMLGKRIVMGFGGLAGAYAQRWHDDLTYTPKKAGTGPNYLSGPLRQAKSGMLARLGARIRQLTDRGRALPNPRFVHPQSPWENR